MTINGIEDLRRMDPASDIENGPLDARALTDLQRVTSSGNRPPRIARPGRRIALAATGIAALAAAAVVVDFGESPAFAVERNDDGTVTVQIERFEDADGIEAAIERYGVNAEVDYLPWGKTCRQPRYTVAPTADQQAATPVADSSSDGVQLSIVLRPGDFAADETLVIVHSNLDTGAGEVASMLHLIAKGPVAVCEPVDVMLPHR
jgi:hypothetical protein